MLASESPGTQGCGVRRLKSSPEERRGGEGQERTGRGGGAGEEEGKGETRSDLEQFEKLRTHHP